MTSDSLFEWTMNITLSFRDSLSSTQIYRPILWRRFENKNAHVRIGIQYNGDLPFVQEIKSDITFSFNKVRQWFSPEIASTLALDSRIEIDAELIQKSD